MLSLDDREAFICPGYKGCDCAEQDFIKMTQRGAEYQSQLYINPTSVKHFH